MGVGVKLSGAPSSTASFSIISKSNQNCRVDEVDSLGASLFFLFVDVVMFPLLIFVPCRGEFVSLIMKFGSAVRSLAAPRLPPCLVILNM